MLQAASHYLGRFPTSARRKNMVRLFKDAGQTLPCALCRADWGKIMKSFSTRQKGPGNLYAYTITTQLFFTFLYDLRVGWIFARGMPMPETWDESNTTFQIAARQADNVLVALYPKLYNKQPPQAAEDCASETCQCGICSLMNWGPYFWTYLQTIGGQEHLFQSACSRRWVWRHINFVASCVPCGECFLHWQNAMRNINPFAAGIVASPLACFTFLYDLHNIWNKKLNKPIYSWNDAVQQYHWNPATPYNSAIWKEHTTNVCFW